VLEETFVPELSVVTIVKNDPEGLSKTLESVISQKNVLWQAVVVLSSKDDSSAHIAAEYQSQFKQIEIVHQEDRGIYQAMNLGWKQASGSFLWFMNAGDSFISPDTASFALTTMKEKDCEVLIGGYVLDIQPRKVFQFSEKKISALHFSLNIRSGSHQAICIGNSGDFEKQFDAKYKLAGDFKLILNRIKHGGGYRVSRELALVEPGGRSDLGIDLVLREKQEIRRDFFGKNSFGYFSGVIWTLGVKSKIKARKVKTKLLRA
jgi:glycosyltransferase involved in cell wall biosynthesis